MNQKTLKTLELIGAVVVFLGAVAGIAYGIYRFLENKKLKELDYTFDSAECWDDTDFIAE